MIEAGGSMSDEISEFMFSERHPALIENTQRYLDSHPHINGADFMGSFAGRLFEELGYLWYIKGLEDKYRLLDPDETQTYFLQLYGGLPSQTLLQGGIFNEYLPDGVILPADGYPLKGDAVVVEYTVSAPNARLPKYIHHKEEMVKRLRKRFPEIFGEGTLQIVFASETHPTIMRTKNVDRRTGLIASPHSRRTVRTLARDLVLKHFPHVHP